jgi:hypothetical protein
MAPQKNGDNQCGEFEAPIVEKAFKHFDEFLVLQ